MHPASRPPVIAGDPPTPSARGDANGADCPSECTPRCPPDARYPPDEGAKCPPAAGDGARWPPECPPECPTDAGDPDTRESAIPERGCRGGSGGWFRRELCAPSLLPDPSSLMESGPGPVGRLSRLDLGRWGGHSSILSLSLFHTLSLTHTHTLSLSRTHTRRAPRSNCAPPTSPLRVRG